MGKTTNFYQDKHLIGIEPINSCSEDKCCTNSAKDVKKFFYLFLHYKYKAYGS